MSLLSALPGLVLSLSLAGSMSGTAETSTAAPAAPFSQAETLLEARRAAEALDVLEASLVEGGLAPEALLRLWSLKGRALALVGQAQRAERAFAVALRVDPRWRLPAQERDPAITGPYHAALAALPPGSKALSVWLRLESTDAARTLAYQLIADDLGLVSGAEARVGDIAREVALSLDDMPKELALPASDDAVTFRLLDAYGNALRIETLATGTPVVEGGKGIAAAATPSTTAAAAGGLRWLALGGGTTMALGAAGVMAAGIGMSAIDDGKDAPDGTKDVLVGGVAVATGLVVVGAVLIATDFLLDPP